MQLSSAGSSPEESNFHLVFTPKYLREVFTYTEVRQKCLESFAQTCCALRMGLEACVRVRSGSRAPVRQGVQELLLRPLLVQRFKGASSHRIRRELQERIKDKPWGDSFWSDGYFYGSIGSTTRDAVPYRIEQNQHKKWMSCDYEQTREEEQARMPARLDES